MGWVPLKAEAPSSSLDLDRLASEEGADPNLVRAVMGAESSGGKDTRTSPNGAMGAMQIIPATFKRFAKQGETIDNPEHNVRVGARYIKFLADRVGGDPFKVGAAYLSGEGNVDQWGIVNDDVKDAHGTRPSMHGKKIADTYRKLTGGEAPVSGDIKPSSFLLDRPQQPKPEKEIGVLEAAGRGITHGAIGLAESVNLGGQFLAGRMGAQGAQEFFKAGADWWSQVAKGYEPPPELQGNILDRPELLGKGAWWAYSVADMIPSLASTMVPALGTYSAMVRGPEAIARLARIGAAVTGGTVGGAQEGLQTYKTVLERGGSDGEAAVAGTLMALASAGLNALSLDFMLGKSTSGLKKFFLSGAVESLSEWAEEPAEGAILSGTTVARPEDDPLLRLREGANVVPPSFLLGGLGGAAGGQRKAPQAPPAPGQQPPASGAPGGLPSSVDDVLGTPPPGAPPAGPGTPPADPGLVAPTITTIGTPPEDIGAPAAPLGSPSMWPAPAGVRSNRLGRYDTPAGGAPPQEMPPAGNAPPPDVPPTSPGGGGGVQFQGPDGAQYRVQPITPELFDEFIRPDLRDKKVRNWQEYNAKYPSITHMRLRSDDGVNWQPTSAPFVGSAERLQQTIPTQPAMPALPDDAAIPDAPTTPALEESTPTVAKDTPVSPVVDNPPPAISIDDAAQEAATSQANDTPEPTPAQQEAGNYKKGHVKLHGLDISVENPRGSVRSGTDEDGKAWESVMQSHYGYIRRTEGADGDHIDTFIGPNPDAEQVFVVDQINPKTGAFDEHKVMLGFDSQEEAEAGYRANYDPDWKGMGAVTPMTVEEFRAWLKDGDVKAPVSKSVGITGLALPEEGITRPGPSEQLSADEPTGTSETGETDTEPDKSGDNTPPETPADAGVSASGDEKTPPPAKKTKAKKPAPPAEGEAASKLQNTGVDLRRWYEQLKEDAETAKTDGDRTLELVLAATERAKLWTPALGEGATPGLTRWMTALRSKVQTFREWALSPEGNLYEEVQTNWRYSGDSPTQRIRNWANDTPADTAREVLMDAAKKYIEMMQSLLSKFDGATGVEEAAKRIDALLVENQSERSWTIAWKPEFKTELAPLFGATYRDAREFSWFTSTGTMTKQAIAKEADEVDADQAKRLVPPRLERVERDMPKPAGEGDTTPAEMKKEFGFADIGFGAYVPAKRDQAHLNAAFDAFADLAELLDLPREAIGFFGKLHFTVGALGHGKFAAHFAPAQPHPNGGTVPVINVTNTRGDGTVAHEWGHALDYLSLMASPTVRNEVLELLRRSFDFETVRNNVQPLIKGHSHMTRSGPKGSEENLRSGVHYYAFGRARQNTAYYENALALGRDYWGNDRELIARAWETFVLDSLGGVNTYLVQPVWVGEGIVTKEAGYRGTPYPTGDERKLIVATMAALAKSIVAKDGAMTIDVERWNKAKPTAKADYTAAYKELHGSIKRLHDEREAAEKARAAALRDAQAENEKKRAEEARAQIEAMRRLEEAEAAARRAAEERAKAEATPSESVSPNAPMTDEQLEALFGQAVSELQEAAAEQPDTNDLGKPKAPKRPPKEKRPKWADDLDVHVGDRFTFNMPSSYATGEMTIMSLTSDSIEVRDEAGSGTFLKRWELEKGMREGNVTRLAAVETPDTTPAAPSTAAGLAAEAAKLGVQGIDEALKGLTKLFGGKGRLGSGPSFDEDTYAQAKPHFEAALTKFQAAGQTALDLFKFLIRNFGEGIKPYLFAFAKERKLSLDLGGARNARTEGNEGDGGEGDAGPRAGDVSTPDAGRNPPASPNGPGPSVDGDVLNTRRDGEGGAGAESERADADSGDGRRTAEGVGGGRGDSARLPRGTDYRLTDIAREGSWRETAKRNLDIIELSKKIEDEKRRATPEEQALLAQYTGWGASDLAQNIFPLVPDWAKRANPGRVIYPEGARPEYRELSARAEKIMTPDELREAAASTRNAHYTSSAIIRSIFSTFRRMGFRGGRAFEGGMGTGLFHMHMPGDMAAMTSYLGVERDILTARIARLLLPNQTVLNGDLAETKLPGNYFDIAWGNPPFGDDPVLADPAYSKYKFLLHDYFLARSIDALRPGGIFGVVVSKGTMDKVSDKARSYIADRADLLGAIRLPQTAFEQNAGTEVVTDVLFFQKREPGAAASGPAWTQVKTFTIPFTPKKDMSVMFRDPLSGGVQSRWLQKGVEQDIPITINEYFADHPEMVLGRHSLGGTMYSAGSYTVEPIEGDIEALFDKAAARLPAGVYKPRNPPKATDPRKAPERDMNPSTRKEGALYLNDKGEVLIVDAGSGVGADEINLSFSNRKLTDDDHKWLKSYAGLKHLVKVALQKQWEDAADWESALGAVRKAYDKHVKKWGQINAFEYRERVRKGKGEEEDTVTSSKHYKNWRLLRLDVESSLIEALETETEDGSVVPSKFFTKRTIRKPAPPEIRTTSDALAVVLNEQGRLDIPAIAKLRDVSEEAVIAELGDLIYETPLGEWQMTDEYLSGDVVEKLEHAMAAAAVEPQRFARNVLALQKVQPLPLGPDDIQVNLGAVWTPPDVVRDFASEVLGLYTAPSYSGTAGVWKLQDDEKRRASARSLRSAADDWGTPDRSSMEILEAVLNSKEIKVTRTEKSVDTTKTYTDAAATEAANEVAKKMRERFKTWVWSDVERASTLLKIYNRRYNNLAPRVFNGEHLTLPGVSALINPYPHQRSVIWRAIQTGDVYAAHAVGAGKTFEMIAAGMEMRRLGMISKPMYVVPNHMLNQFAREFQEFYPAASIMVADDENFTGPNRRRFVARAALNSPDAIVITHSAFGKIGLSDENHNAYIQAIVGELDQAIMEEDDKRSPTRKRLESQKKRLESRLKDKSNTDAKDQNISFEALGVDYLFVDEAHEYRKLDFVTNRGNIKGIDPAGSQKAFDLWMRVQYLHGRNPGRTHFFASGTPITNTIGEMFTAMKFFMLDQLRSENLHHFDAWSQQFGEVQTDAERNAAGNYEMIERFARFVNVPEMMKRFRTFADVITSEQLGKLVKRPALKDGKPEFVVSAPSEELEDYMASVLATRIEVSKAWKPSPNEPYNPDPIIAIITDGRLSTLDDRFFNPVLPSNPESKLNKMIDRIIATAERIKDDVFINPGTGEADPVKGGVQIVFSSVGLGEGVARSRGFNARAWIDKRLREGGFKAGEVVWMSDLSKDADKEKAFANMRAGKVKVLIGSPKNMGTGVNVQRRLKALHFLSPPWFPSDVEQPHGRILRQGNQNTEVEISWYMTEGTYDATMWQMVDRKGRFINQALQGDDTVRTLEDISEDSPYAQAAAIATGDQRAIQLANLQQEVDRFRRLHRAWQQTRNTLASDIRFSEANLAFYEEEATDAAAALAKLGDAKTTPVTLGEKTYADRAEAAAALAKVAFTEIRALMTKSERGTKAIGKLGDIGELVVQVDPLYSGGDKRRGRLTFRAGKNYSDTMFDMDDRTNFDDISVTGMADRVTNVQLRLPSKVEALNDKIADTKKSLEQARRKAAEPFKHKDEMEAKSAEIAKIEGEIHAAAAATKAAADARKAAAQSAPRRDDDEESFARGARPPRALPVKDVEAAIAPTRRIGKGLPPTMVVQSQRQLPDSLQRAIEDSGSFVKAAYHEGSIYIIADHVESTDEASYLMLHEAAHFGLEGIFGRELAAVMMKIWTDNPKIREKAAAFREKHGVSQAKAVEEVLAEMAADGEKATVLQRFVSWVRDWFRRRGMQVKMSEGDILTILSRAQGYWKRSPKWTHLYSSTSFARGDQEAQFDDANPRGWGEVEAGPVGAQNAAIPTEVVADDTAATVFNAVRTQLSSRGLGDLPADALARVSPQLDRLSDADAVRGRDIRGAERIAGVFGHEVVWFENNAAQVRDFGGFVSGLDPKRIYINVRGYKPHLEVVGHELLHQMRRERPDLYDRFVTAVSPLLRNADRHQHPFAKNDDKQLEELLADFSGWNFMRRGFWREMAARDRNAFGKIADYILSFLDSLVLKMSKFVGDRSVYFSDVKAAQTALAEVMAEFKSGKAPMTTQTLEFMADVQTETPAFRDWFRDSKVVDDQGRPLVVYHGTNKNISEIKSPGRGKPAGWFAANPELANLFTGGGRQNMGKGGKKGGVVYPVYLSLQNPVDLGTTSPGDNLSVADVLRMAGMPAGDDALGAIARANLDSGYVGVSTSIADPVAYLVREYRSGSGRRASNTLDDEGLINALRAAGFDGWRMKEEGSATFAVFDPTQIKSAISNNGRFDPGNPGIQFADNAPPSEGRFTSSYGNQARRAIDWIDAKLDPIGLLPGKGDYLAKRYATLGRIARLEEVSKDLHKIFGQASDEDQQAAYRYFLTPEGDPKMIPGNAAREAAVRAKKLIESVGDALVSREMMTPETREAHRGRYLPQVYLKFLLGDQNWKMLGAGKKVSDRGYLKNRKLDRIIGEDGEVHVVDAVTRQPVDEEFLNAMLGPVKDPGFLASMAIVKPSRDMAILDFLEQISANEEWVLPHSTLEWRGRRVSAHWAKKESERLRKQARHMADPEASTARTYAEELDKLADEALGKVTQHPDYRQIPDTARYGRLRGIYVRKEIYDDIMGVNDFLPEDPGWFQSLFGYGGIGSKVTALWKAGKVSLNPPAQIRNAVSNFVLLQLSGVSLIKAPGRVIQAWKEIANGGPNWEIAKKFGVTESTWSSQELFRMRRDILEIEQRAGTLKAWGKVKLLSAAMMDFAGDKYQFMEALFKTAKIIDEKARGKSDADAAIEAQRWLFDYSLVPKSVRYARSAPIGMPFLTFAYKVLPRLIEVAALHPQRFLPWVAIAYGLPMLVAQAWDVDDDDIEQLKMAMPEWLRERGHAYILPYKDERDRWQVLDLGYFFPWTTWTEPLRNAAEGEVGKAAQGLGLFSGPITDLIVANATGKDSFTGRDIVQKGDPPQRQFLSIMNYLWSMAAPPIITDYGAAGHALRAATGTTNRYGDPLSSAGQAALRAIGINIYALNPEMERARAVKRMVNEIDDTMLRLKTRLSDRGLSKEDRDEIVAEYVTEMKRRQQKIRDYLEESEIHPNLKAGQ